MSRDYNHLRPGLILIATLLVLLVFILVTGSGERISTDARVLAVAVMLGVASQSFEIATGDLPSKFLLPLAVVTGGFVGVFRETWYEVLFVIFLGALFVIVGHYIMQRAHTN